MQIFIQVFVLGFSFCLIFFEQQTVLVAYNVQLLGFLIFAYILVAVRKKGKGFLTLGGEGPWGIFILNTLILLLIFSTGRLDSPLFFLLYFLAFGIAFVFEPLTVFVFILGALLVFLPDALKNDLTVSFLKLGGLLLISPLAFFFGQQYQKSDREEEKIEALEERTKEAADTIAKDLETVIKEEKQNLAPKDIEKINEVLEETEDLRQESKEI
jgi:hypothetical protein